MKFDGVFDVLVKCWDENGEAADDHSGRYERVGDDAFLVAAAKSRCGEAPVTWLLPTITDMPMTTSSAMPAQKPICFACEKKIASTSHRCRCRRQ